MATVQTFPWPTQSLHETRPRVDAAADRAESADVWDPLSAIKERIGVVLVALLIFSIVLAIAGFVASFDGRRKLAAFEADGRTAIGTIADKSVRNIEQAYWTTAFHGGGDDQVYQVNVCFNAQDRGYHCGTIGVPNGTYDGLRLGSPLKVTYVSWHPDWFYVGDNVPDDRDSDIFTRVFQLSTLAGLLLVIVIAAIVFWQHGDGMVGQPASESHANDVATRFRQRHGFRRRGSPG